MAKRIVFLWICLSALAGLAQPLRPPVINFTPKNYGTAQTPENYCIFQDQRGFIFSGNSGGVLVYDGRSWQFIAVQKGSYVTAIDQAPDGRIYVGTTNGEFGVLTEGKNHSLVFESRRNVFEAGKYDIGRIDRLFCLGKDIYIQTNDNIYLIRLSKVHRVETASSFSLMFKADKAIYARERGVGLISLKGAQKTVLAQNDEFKYYGIFGVVPYDSDRLFIATMEKGFWLYHTKTREALCINSDSAKLKNHLIYGAVALSDGNFALNTLSSGVLIAGRDGKITGALNKASGLQVNDVKQVMQDKHQNLWLAMSNGIGLVNYGSFLQYYNEETGLTGGPECVAMLGNEIYTGTSEGLFVHGPGHADKFFTPVSGISSHVWNIDTAAGRLLVAADNGLYYGNAQGFTRLLSEQVNTVLYLPQRRQALAAGPMGIYLVDLTRGGVLAQTHLDFIVKRCLSIRRDPQSTPQHTIAWMGTLGDGIVRIDIENNQLLHTLYTNLDENALIITRPVELNRSIYFCTASGLRKPVTKNGEMFFDFAGFIPELDNRRISDMVQTPSRIWTRTEDAVYYYDRNKNPVNTPFLPIDLGRINNMYIENDSCCWIAAADGLVNYTPRYDRQYSQPFEVVLRSITVNSDSLLFGGNWFDNRRLVNVQPGSIVFETPYRINSYEFAFSALYFEENARITYAHKLEGLDEKWSQWSAENTIPYSNLHEGTYTLLVKARNVYGVESAPLSIRFTIHPPWYRTIAAYILYGLVLIVLFYITYRILSYRLKQKNIQLEQLVQKRTEEINEQYIQIRHQKQEITDSIHYAQKIQEAMLPFVTEMKQHLPDSFILFKPKDIVSGDFYWFGQYENKLVLICADCTGHGVPGAFMSMLCVDKLNQIIPEKKILMPDKILEAANRGIKKSLGQQDEQNLKTKDGMDAAVVTIDRAANKIYYSGANRPLWLVRNGEITEFKPEKCAVGGFTPEEQVYLMHEIDVLPGDAFYMSTDGYADQFGGPKGKKIMVKHFKELILKHHHLSFGSQCQALDDFVEDWKKYDAENHEQVDDICVTAFKLP